MKRFYELTALYNTRLDAMVNGWKPGDALRKPGIRPKVHPTLIVKSEDPAGACETLFLCMNHNDEAPLFEMVATTERSMSVGDVCEVKDRDSGSVWHFACAPAGWVEVMP